MKTFQEIRRKQIQEKQEFLENIAPFRKQWVERNQYFYSKLYNIIKKSIPAGKTVCHVGCDTTDLLSILKPENGIGVCLTDKQKKICRESNSQYKFFTLDEIRQINGTVDYIIVTSLGYVFDINEFLEEILVLCKPETRLLIVNLNFLWEPIFALGEKIGLRMPQPLQRQNMIPTHHITNLFEMSGFQLVKWSSHILIPINIPVFSWFANRFMANTFPFRFLSSTDFIIVRPVIKPSTPVTCSVVIPCKNEKGNIAPLLKRIPELADKTEIIFIDDKSTDGTGDEMRRQVNCYPEKNVKIIEGPGISKGEAVREGIRHASGDIIAILDADMAMTPEELPKCIKPILDGIADFVNTARFIYPQENRAMRWLNIAGNRFFAFIFTFLLRQKINDTLCGTKVFRRSDYKNIDSYKDYWIWRDQWGDFEQLLGASKLGLKISEVPVHYASRTYGETKMKNRFKNGMQMLKLCIGGFYRMRLD